MERRYFIMNTENATNKTMVLVLLRCIGDVETQRYSLDDSKLFVKTTQKAIDEMLIEFSDYTFEEILTETSSTEHNFEEIETILNGAEWVEPEV